MLQREGDLHYATGPLKRRAWRNQWFRYEVWLRAGTEVDLHGLNWHHDKVKQSDFYAAGTQIITPRFGIRSDRSGSLA
jgi:hypothetical protein